MTEAEKKAKKKYRDKGKRLTVDFYPSEADLISHIESQPNKQGYIKRLIWEDMDRRNVWEEKFSNSTPEEMAEMLFGNE